VPIWIGGASGRALRRAAALGDGWHAYQPNPEQLAGPIAELRRARPEPEFVISNRVDWNEASFAAQVKGFSEAGVQELVIVPTGRDQTSWRACVDEIADACRDFGQ
jgi:alkanesulfonate monooxygenase SsuD/methylene tetrahydromethanopterin reductase-like flavin-dependent oxidoreductase (luciferase family)